MTRTRGLVVAAGLAALAFPHTSTADAMFDRGRQVYERACLGCHGETGEGGGFDAWLAGIRPRDLRRGTFKYRSTPSGSNPTGGDIERTIAEGIPQSSMPHHRMMDPEDREALVAYFQATFLDWDAASGESIEVPDPPAFLGSDSSVARGAEVYDLLQCGACHGPEGKGTGRAARTLPPDAWGQRQRPSDLSRPVYKSGPRPQDVYRTVLTGLDGTSMASYGDVLRHPDGQTLLPDDDWHLVSYVLSFRKSATDSAKKKERKPTYFDVWKMLP